MTFGTDIGLQALDVLLAFYGTSVTYTEAVSGTAQAVTALVENLRQEGDETLLDFTFETTDLTIANWRGAKLVTSLHGTFTASEYSDSDGHSKFTGRRATERF